MNFHLFFITALCAFLFVGCDQRRTGDPVISAEDTDEATRSTSAASVAETAFVGTWELESIEVKGDNGEWSAAPMVEEHQQPVGILMYDKEGNMAVQITTDPRHTESPPNDPDLIHGYVAYYGKYEVDTQAQTITHHRRNHINPEIGKLPAERSFEFSGDILTLSPMPDATERLRWKRVR